MSINTNHKQSYSPPTSTSNQETAFHKGPRERERDRDREIVTQKEIERDTDTINCVDEEQ